MQIEVVREPAQLTLPAVQWQAYKHNNGDVPKLELLLGEVKVGLVIWTLNWDWAVRLITNNGTNFQHVGNSPDLTGAQNMLLTAVVNRMIETFSERK